MTILEDNLMGSLDSGLINTVKIQNVVASVNLKNKIRLEEVASKLPAETQVNYIPEQFPGLVIKIKDPKITCLVFRSGKMVVTGAKNISIIKEGVKAVIELLNTTGQKVHDNPSIIVQNIVASGDIGAKINLELAALLLDNSLYEPEQFPGLIYRMQSPKVVLLLFQSGNIVCTGAKKEDYVYESIKKIHLVLTELDALES
jgi:transcription initiation factor TFIID TATA-box-binding protein